MPKLSVIIPVHNAKDFPAETLESLLQQSLKDIEVVCVDADPADNSLCAFEDLCGKDPRTVLIRAAGCGIGGALNAGIENASGEYIHFLFPGCVVFDYAYEALCNKAVKYKTDILYCSVLNYDPEKKIFLDIPNDSLSCLRTGDFGRLLTLESGSTIYNISTSPVSALFRRAFLKENNIRFSSLEYFSERQFFFEAAIKAERIMAARDRLVCRNIAVPQGGPQGRKFLGCAFRSAENVTDLLEQIQAGSELCEAVLTAEFDNIIFCIKKAYEQSGYDPGSLADAGGTVKSFNVPFSHKLTAKFRNLLKQLHEPVKTKKIRQVRVFHEEITEPKVSVVVPIYNVEDYLNEALNSLTQQTLEEIEFVCVNDGSTDNSLVILKEYAALDKRFRILDGPNGGYGKAMNRGMDAARGKYMGILEPDDLVPENMFSELYKAAEKNQVDLVKADFYRFRQNPDGSLNMRLEQLTGNKDYYGRVICPGKEQYVFKLVMNTWSGIYSLKFLRRWDIRHNETPGAAFQDNGFWFQTFCRAERVLFLNTPFYYYRTDNPASSENNRKADSYIDEYDFIWKWMEKDPELIKRFDRIYYARKFNALIRNYRCLAPKYQPDLLHRISEEFRDVYEQGLLGKENMINSTQWQLFNEIIRDPDAYFKNICVSVIMPVYNSEKYLRQALDGILALNEIPFEVICVEDGSDDASLSILREYEENDSRVRVITQENAGAGAARNAGMQYARGKYLFFPDSDDLYEPELLKNAYNKARRSDADIVVFRCDEYIEETGEFLPVGYSVRSDLIPSVQPFSGSEILQDTFRAFVGWPWDKLFKKEFVIKNGLKFQEIRTTNDLLFVFSAIVKAERIVTYNKVLAHHRKHADSLSVTREKSWHCFYEALCALKQQLVSWNMYNDLEQDFLNYSLNFCLWHLKTVQGKAYGELYDFIKEKAFAELGLLRHGEDYFYNKKEYIQMQTMLEVGAEDFLFLRYMDVQNENKRLRLKVRKMRADLKTEKAEKKKKSAAIRSCQRKIRTLRNRNAALKKESVRMRNSATWKAGCVVIWLPRKIKKMMNKLHGNDSR